MQQLIAQRERKKSERQRERERETQLRETAKSKSDVMVCALVHSATDKQQSEKKVRRKPHNKENKFYLWF